MVNVVNKYWDMIKFGFITTARSRRAEQGPQNNRSLVSDFSEGNSEMTTTLKRKVFIYIFIWWVEHVSCLCWWGCPLSPSVTIRINNFVLYNFDGCTSIRKNFFDRLDFFFLNTLLNDTGGFLDQIFRLVTFKILSWPYSPVHVRSGVLVYDCTLIR